MGRLELQVKANLHNIKALMQPAENDWHFKVKCSSCNNINEQV